MARNRRTGRSRTIPGRHEARLSRQSRRLVWIIGLAVLATIVISLYIVLEPSLLEARLIRTASARSHFIFSAHGGVEDFARQRPQIDEAFRAARAAGQKVLFVLESGDVGWREDPDTGEPLPLEQWWTLIQQRPEDDRDWFDRALASTRERTRLGKLIREGRIYRDASYDADMGSYQHAVHKYLLVHRDTLADVQSEEPSWETHRLHIEHSVELFAAEEAFCKGDVAATVERMQAARALNARYDELRDLRVVLRVGQLLADCPGVRVVTIRGLLHWPMVERYGLKGTMDHVALARTDWNPRRSLDFARIRGEVVSEREVRRLLLLAAPMALAFDALADEEGLVDRHAVAKLLSGSTALQSMPAFELEALSIQIGRRTAASAKRIAAGRRVLLEILRERRLLPPAGWNRPTG
jgi:hypothetical protein